MFSDRLSVSATMSVSPALSAEEIAAAYEKDFDLEFEPEPISDAKFVVPQLELNVEKLERELRECMDVVQMYLHQQWREGYEFLKKKQRNGFFYMIGLALNHALLGGLGVNKVTNHLL